MNSVASVLALSAVLLLTDAFGADSSPVAVKGDSFEQVIQKLGPPKGQVKGGQRTTYYYDRGTVDFMTGRVTRAFLVTAEEAKEKMAAREKEEADMRQRAEAERIRVAAAGKAQLEKMLSDKTFTNSPPGVQLAYWEDFQKQYPGIDVSTPVSKARKELDVASQENGQVKELLALNTRAAEIENRFQQLNRDYAASLANWKRVEIDQERAKLTRELNGITDRVAQMLK